MELSPCEVCNKKQTQSLKFIAACEFCPLGGNKKCGGVKCERGNEGSG